MLPGRETVTLGQENINSPVSAQLNLNMVLLVREILTTLDLVSTYNIQGIFKIIQTEIIFYILAIGVSVRGKMMTDFATGLRND